MLWFGGWKVEELGVERGDGKRGREKGTNSSHAELPSCVPAWPICRCKIYITIISFILLFPLPIPIPSSISPLS
jgi:hypothetical protein